MAAMAQQASGKNIETRDTAALARHTEAVVSRSRTTFYWAMRRMTPDHRAAMFAIYAYCREIDDIADEPGSAHGKRGQLQRYRDGVEALFSGGDPGLPTLRALAGPVATYNLARADFDALIDGMMTDAAPRIRMADDAALATYVDQVACTVGRLCCPVFGLPIAVHAPLALSLGTALQLTNILRDIREDAARDRIYLPANRLRDVGLENVPAYDLADRRELAPVLDALAGQARQHFEDADTIMAQCDAGQIRPARMMRTAYGRLFDKVVEAGFSPLPAHRVRLGKVEKAILLLRYGVF